MHYSGLYFGAKVKKFFFRANRLCEKSRIFRNLLTHIPFFNSHLRTSNRKRLHFFALFAFKSPLKSPQMGGGINR